MTMGRPPGSRDLHGRAVRSVTISRRTPRYARLAADFGRQLRQTMVDRQIAASELAAAIDVSPMTVHGWRRGRSIPAVACLFAVAGALGCALVDLLPESARYP